MNGLQSENKQAFQMSPQQRRLWTLMRVDGPMAYTTRCAALIEGSFEPEAFARIVRETISAHEILRTTFQRLPGMSVETQIVGESEPAVVAELDWSDLGPAEQQRKIDALYLELGSEVFDLEQGPVLRFWLASLGGARWALVIACPSVIADGESLHNLLREIGERSSESWAGPETLQYAELAEWQNQLLEDEETEAGRKFWAEREYFDSVRPRLSFESSTDETTAFSPASLAFSLRGETLDRIRALASTQKVEIVTVMQACWQSLLARLARAQTVVLGLRYDGRRYAELAGALGPFEQYLPLRAAVDDGQVFSELLGVIEQEAAELFERQEYFSFESAATAGEGFYPYCFSYHEAPADLSLGDARLTILDEDSCTERFGLKLSVINGESELKIKLQFDRARFLPADIQRLRDRFETILESALASPRAPLGALEIVGRDERRELIQTFNGTAREFQNRELIHELIARQAQAFPDRPALRYEDEVLSYAELNAAANRLAHLLRAKGATTDSRIALLLDRSADMIVSVVGIWKSGGAYLAIEPGHPKDRLAGMLADAGVEIVITKAGSLDMISEIGLQSICLDADRALIESQSDADSPNAAQIESLAYVIYTSGSTGRPKGVAVEHRQLLNYVYAVEECLDLPAGASYATASTLAADLGNTSIFPSLCTGGCLHVISQDRLTDANALAEYFSRYEIDCLKIVPSHLEALLAGGQAGSILPRKRLILGGEAARPQLIERIESLGHSCRIFNHYGPTETTIGVLTCEAPAGSNREQAMKASAIPLGRPIPNVQVYLLNSYLQPAAAGTVGEVYIGGASVTRGYLNRPDLTADRFIPDPFGVVPGGRLYRTGDLARLLPDGNLTFLGRADDQVKIRGYRIELGEIESAIRLHSGVDSVIVLPTEPDAADAGRRRLIAFVVPNWKFRRTVQGRNRYRLPNRMEIAHLNKSETDYGYREIFERKSYFKHGVSLKPGACVFDVGANIGLFSLYVNAHYPTAFIHAFEPVKAIYDVLRLNAELYGTNIRTHNHGLSDAGGSASFTYYPGYSVMSGIAVYSDAEAEKRTLRTILRNREDGPDLLLEHAGELIDDRFAGQSATCRLATLSEIIARESIEKIDLLKIDVQKAEVDVLRGLREQDWEKIDQIVMETHDMVGDATEGRLELMIDLLGRRGYRVVAEQEDELLGTDRHTIYAVRNDESALAEIETLVTGQAPVAPYILDSDDLEPFLRQALPDYMIPASFLMLDALPLNLNGKIDRKALLAFETAQRAVETDFDEPRTETEIALAKIWADSLGLERVGVNDNFFKLGGDSILSIQIIVKANQAGIHLTPRQFFQHQTIAQLAAVANQSGVVEAEQGPVVGPAPLTPIQHWFFGDDPLDPQYWTMALLLEARRPLDSRILAQSAAALLAHHDALRLRFANDESDPTRWTQVIGDLSETASAQTLLTVVDLSEVARGAESESIERAAAQFQSSLDLSAGPMIRLAHFIFSDERPARLLIVIHHLCVDGVSWRILLDDLQTVYAQLSANGEVRLPRKSTSFRRWAEGLERYAESEELRNEAHYWLDLPWTSTRGLPKDFDDSTGRFVNTVGASRAVAVSLSSGETQSLLQKAPEAYNTQINDLLLAALAQTLHQWTSARVHLIDLEGHGREDILDGVDLGRTVGCFTTRFPVLLETEETDDPGEQLKSTKELLRRTPNKGVGFGVLRYLSDFPELSERFHDLPKADISFNYLGQLDQALGAENAAFAPAFESAGPVRSLRAARRYLLEINGAVAGGRLEFTWRYAEGVYQQATIERVAEGFLADLRSLIDHCLTMEGRDFTASDFADFGWNEEDLTQILGKINEAA